MNLIFPDVGLVWLLRRVVAGGLKYHLFTNNATPGPLSTLASFTEATWSGYAVVIVNAGDWNVSAVEAHVGDLEAPPIGFVNASGSPKSAYGYFVTDMAGTQLVCATLLDEAPVTKAFGDSFFVDPILGSYSGLAA